MGNDDMADSPKATVLIIDDEQPIRATLRHVLEKAGFSIIEADNGQRGLECLRRQAVDLIVTDIIMPEKEGIESIIEFRRYYPSVKIIAISGGGHIAHTDILAVAQKLGADRVLAKPFRGRELLDMVTDCLGRRSSPAA